MQRGRHTWLAQRDESSLNSCVGIGHGAHEKSYGTFSDILKLCSYD